MCLFLQRFDTVGWVGIRKGMMPLPLTVSCFSKIQIGFTFPFWYRLDLGSAG